MGVRIHKRIGWGLKTKKNDKRLNSAKIQEICESKKTLKDFSDWVNTNRNLCIDIVDSTTTKKNKITYWKDYSTGNLLHIPESLQKTKVSYTITFPDDEFHSEALVLSIPEYHEKAYRHDDTIDYYESGVEPTNKIMDLSEQQGIFPFTGMEMIPGITIPEHLKDKIEKTNEMLIYPSDYAMLVGWWNKKEKPLAKGEYLSFLKKNYRPVIPESIVLLIYYTGILKDFDKDIQKFRPMIYTYWS